MFMFWKYFLSFGIFYFNVIILVDLVDMQMNYL